MSLRHRQAYAPSDRFSPTDKWRWSAARRPSAALWLIDLLQGRAMKLYKEPSSTAANCQSDQDCTSSCLVGTSAHHVASLCSNMGILQKASHLTWSESASTAHYVKACLSSLERSAAVHETWMYSGAYMCVYCVRDARKLFLLLHTLTF